MTRNIRKYVVLPALVAVAAAAIGGPAMSSAASKKTYKYKMVGSNGKFDGTTITADYKGKPFGKCKAKGTLVLPRTTQTWKCKGGSFRVKTVTTTGAANVSVSDVKIDKGTGKYKGIKGTGKSKGLISVGDFTYTGTVRY